MPSLASDWTVLPSEPLCVAEFAVGGPILSIGSSPFGEQRIGYVTGGGFDGPRLRGDILPGGGNWPRGGRLSTDSAVGTFDARALWRTHDDALIYVTYTGRSVVPDAVTAAFRDPKRADDVALADYKLRIALVFETAAPAYAWLNGVLAVGCGRRIATGVRHSIFAIT